MADAKWYEDMAKAMKEREKCLSAITRWQAALADVEAEIEALRNGTDVPEKKDDGRSDLVRDWPATSPQLVEG